MSSGTPYFGIDFGTTNSSMAWYNPDTKQAETIPNAEGEHKTPSLVYFGEAETLVGKPVEELIEDSENYEEEERLDITQRVVKSIKRNLLDPPIIPIPGRSKPVRPVEVVAEILKKLKRDAENEYFQEEIHQAVITYPAIFSTQQRKVLFDAATTAGFKIVDLVEEPVAAAMAFSRLGRKVGRGIMVYDLGGGTFDLVVVTREDKDEFRVAMEPDGDKRCGGDDFDQAIYDYCEQLAQRELERSVGEADGAVNPYFLNECRKQKEMLTARERVVIREYLEGVLFKAPLDRETFEGLISDEVEKTVSKTTSMVERAKGRGNEVDTVVLIGGSSRVPLVDRRLKETLGVEPQKFANKDYAVALGAAYYASGLELPPREQYRRALEISWADEKLNREEMEHLSSLLEELVLSGDKAAEIEREILGATFEEVLDRQLGEYRSAVREAWDHISTLARELGVSDERVAEIKHEIVGEQEAVPARPDREPAIPDRSDEFALTHTLTGHSNGATSVAFSPDGRTIASGDVDRIGPGSTDRMIRLWDVRTAEVLRTLTGHRDSIYSVAFSPDGQFLVSAGDDRKIKLWNLETGELLQTLTGQIGRVWSVAVSPDSMKVAVGSSDSYVKLWDFQTNQRQDIYALEGDDDVRHTDSIYSVAFSPDGSTIASGSGDMTIKLWGVSTGALLGNLTGHSDVVGSVAFSPDGQLLASGSDDETVKLWDARTGEPLRTFTGHTDDVNSVAFSPDGQILASGSNDKTVRLWNLETGELLQTLTGHSDLITSVAFSPDGRLLVSSSGDETIKIWGKD